MRRRQIARQGGMRVVTVFLALLAAPAAPQETYQLTPLVPVVQPNGEELGSGTQSLTTTVGSVAISVSDGATNKGGGTVMIESPGIVSGTKAGGTTFQVTPPGSSVIKHTLTGFDLIELSTGLAPIFVCRGGGTTPEPVAPRSIGPCTFQRMEMGSDGQSIDTILRIRVRTPPTPQSRFLAKDVTYQVTFRWKLTSPCDPSAAAAGARGAKGSSRLANDFPTCPLDLAIDHIQVVQAIPELGPRGGENRVTLIGGRPTVMRSLCGALARIRRSFT